MALRDLLVFVDASRQTEMRLTLAADLARRHEATLIGIHVIDVDRTRTGPARVLSYAEMAQMQDDVREEAGRLEGAFWERTRRNGLLGEWRVAEGPTASVVALHARYADMVVLGQIDPEDPVAQMAKGSVEQVLLSSGRPVLLIPQAGRFETVGETVLIGWKASREAARAVNDAIPVLEKSNSVTVLAVNPEHGICGDGDLPAADIARHLARHGISVNVAQRTTEPRAECDALLDYAADLRADLLVIGGYGHLTQSIMGGVTRALLQRARVPLLLSH